MTVLLFILAICYAGDNATLSKSNNYIDFDGTDDYADCGSITPDTGDLTIEFILELNATTGGRELGFILIL